VVFLDRGRIVLAHGMDDVEARFLELLVRPEHLAEARALRPIHQRQALGRNVLLFEGADRSRLAALGELRTPSLADLFVAVVGGGAGDAPGAAR
jgi:ABC-2 type transport system ATP-binding protein